LGLVKANRGSGPVSVQQGRQTDTRFVQYSKITVIVISIITTRRYCNPSCLLVNTFVCLLVCSFDSSHPITGCSDRWTAGGSAVGGHRFVPLVEVAPCKRYFLHGKMTVETIYTEARVGFLCVPDSIPYFCHIQSADRPFQFPVSICNNLPTDVINSQLHQSSGI